MIAWPLGSPILLNNWTDRLKAVIQGIYKHDYSIYSGGCNITT
jgi:hypothetical protein